jgi:radical SAM protein with 4Fe4S-binding SPASM domain
LASNGLWAPPISDFICRNIDTVTLSFDGVKAVQDAQRPRRSHRGSFDSVLRSIRALDAAGVKYGIRMTVTPSFIEQLAEGVRLLCHETGARTIQIETSFTAARGVYSDPSAEEGERFVEAFLLAGRIASEHGVFVSYSGARPWVIAHTFCLAPTQALIATPEGRLVACFEAAGDEHPYAGEFTIGRVTSNGVEYDPAAHSKFQQRQEARRSACGECFCYWHCCGDCASRAMASKAPTSMRCNINREITKAIIAGYIERDGGVWTGRS